METRNLRVHMEKHIRKRGGGVLVVSNRIPLPDPHFFEMCRRFSYETTQSRKKNEKSDSYLSQSEERFSSKDDLAVEFRETDLTT